MRKRTVWAWRGGDVDEEDASGATPGAVVADEDEADEVDVDVDGAEPGSAAGALCTGLPRSSSLISTSRIWMMRKAWIRPGRKV